MLILLAGIHGVGKTSLALAAEIELGFKHISASTLIRQQMGMETWNLSKVSSDVQKNQLALLNGIKAERKKWQYMILDGHIALRGLTGIEILDKKIIEEIGIDAIILIEASAVSIAERIEVRDGLSWTIDEIQELAIAEKLGCIEISSVLQIPLVILTEPDSDTFCRNVGILQQKFDAKKL